MLTKIKRFFMFLFLLGLGFGCVTFFSLQTERDHIEACKQYGVECELGPVHRLMSTLSWGMTQLQMNVLKLSQGLMRRSSATPELGSQKSPDQPVGKRPSETEQDEPAPRGEVAGEESKDSDF